MSRKTIIVILGIYWAAYGTVAALIEPLTWFSSSNILTRLGYWGHLLLLVIPTVPLIIWYIRRLRVEKYLGVTSFSSGAGRDDAFQNIRRKAKSKIFVLGIAMSNIGAYAKNSLAEQAENVDIDLLMIDPDYLDNNPSFAESLESFLNMGNFRQTVRNSFDQLYTFCTEWNANQYNRHKFRLRVYNTIPTSSMVMIDPDTNEGECVVEFFLYDSGEHRPRFNCIKTNGSKGLFNVLHAKYSRLWNKSRIIIQ